MAPWIGDLGVGESLKIGVETIIAAGEHGDVDAVPAQFQRLDDPGRAGADDDDRQVFETIGRDFLTDHRVGRGSGASFGVPVVSFEPIAVKIG